jgi:hypothetical protein
VPHCRSGNSPFIPIYLYTVKSPLPDPFLTSTYKPYTLDPRCLRGRCIRGRLLSRSLLPRTPRIRSRMGSNVAPGGPRLSHATGCHWRHTPAPETSRILEFIRFWQHHPNPTTFIVSQTFERPHTTECRSVCSQSPLEARPSLPTFVFFSSLSYSRARPSRSHFASTCSNARFSFARFRCILYNRIGCHWCHSPAPGSPSVMVFELDVT